MIYTDLIRANREASFAYAQNAAIYADCPDGTDDGMVFFTGPCEYKLLDIQWEGMSRALSPIHEIFRRCVGDVRPEPLN